MSFRKGAPSFGGESNVQWFCSPVDDSGPPGVVLDTGRSNLTNAMATVVIHVVQPFNNSIMGVGLDQLVMKESNEELGKRDQRASIGQREVGRLYR